MEQPTAPLRIEAKDQLEPKGASSFLHTHAEIQPVQLKGPAGIAATVVIANRGGDPIEFVHPAVTTNLELETGEGRALNVVRTGPSLHSGTPLPHLKLAPGEEDRFVVTVRAIHETREVPADAEPRPKGTRDLPAIDTMGSDDARNGNASGGPQRVVPLAPGRYRLRLQIVLASPHDPDTPRSIRVLRTDPVTVTYRAE